MNENHLGTYLNDHLAGSEAGLQLVARLAEQYPDTDFAREMQALHAQIADDQQVLQRLLDSVASGGSPLKQLVGWVAEKLTRVKLGMTTAHPLALFEALEALSLGILGKRALWRGLAVIPAELGSPAPDVAELERRALDQWARVEAWRVWAAERAFKDMIVESYL